MRREPRVSVWLSVFTSALLVTVSAYGAIPQSERTALIALYEATGGSTWTDSSGWSGSPGTECSWFGVSCNSPQSAVTHIELPSNNLVGTLPAEIGGFSSLIRLDLSNNSLSGPLVAELGQLTSLEDLTIGGNQFSGAIPATFAGLASLRIIDLFGNQLTGSVPSYLGQLSTLEVIVLEANDLSGGIPAGLSGLTSLRTLNLSDNQLTGEIPVELGNITSLTALYLYQNDLTGGIPRELGDLQGLTALWLFDNHLTGTIPPELGNLTELYQLYLFGNPISGEIPRELAQLTNLEALLLGSSRLSGTIPPELGGLTKMVNLEIASSLVGGEIPRELGNLVELRFLSLDNNVLTGEIPQELANLKKLEILRLGGNSLSGPLPGFIGDFSELRTLTVDGNRFEGAIPPSLGMLSKLEQLNLGANRFTGPIAPELGQLTSLQTMNLSANGLTGEVPTALMNLTQLPDDSCEFFYNGLYSTNSGMISFLNRVQTGDDFEEYQTITPRNFRVSAVKANEIVVSWDRILYTIDPGGYQVEVYDGATLAKVIATQNKFETTVVIPDLAPSSTYSFVVRAVTYPFGFQRNAIESSPSAPIFATTTAAVPSPAQVVVTSFPFALVQAPGAGGGISTYTLQNFGDMSTNLTITQSGGFFTQSQSSVTLAPGGQMTIQLDGIPQSTGAFNGEAIVSGNGTPAGGLRIAVSLLSVGEFAGRVIVDAETSRVDVSAPAGTNPTGSITFTNRGDATMNGMAIADVAWIVPQSGLVTIPAGGSQVVSFSVDRSRRPDSEALSGAATGNLVLVYPQGSGASGRSTFGGAPSTSLVTVVDTVRPDTSSGSIPPIGSDEIALFLPGVGHVVGGVGLFLSDLTLTNAFGSSALDDIKMFFTPSADASVSQTTSSNLAPVVPGEGVKLADVVTTVFGVDQVVGSLQIRTPSATSIFASSNIFNVSNPAGTYGTVIPTFRSDRGTEPGETTTLTGIRKSATQRTNLFVQEVSGNDVSVTVDFVAASGDVVSSIDADIPAFRMARLLDRAPEGAITARVRNTSSVGAIVAYATPVDQASGDFWSVVDWNRQYQSVRRVEVDTAQGRKIVPAAELMIIPVAGSLRGANDTFFRTDVAVSNPEDVPAVITLTFRPSAGSTQTVSLTLAPGEGVEYEDIVGDLFGLDGGLGSISVDAATGAVAVSSRTFATVGGLPGSYGTGVPTVPLSGAIRRGQLQQISGIEVSSIATVQAGTPGTFRTNVGLVEAAGEAAKVRVSVKYADAKSLTFGALTSFEIDLAPNASVLISDLSGRIPVTASGQDLRNVSLEFRVVSGNGAVVAYASSIDNGTGDSILRTE